MKNILHVFKTYFPDAPGGVQEAIRAISLYTREYGFRHSVFALSLNPVPQEVDFEGTLVHRERQIAAPLSCPIGNWESFRALRSMAEDADIILYHYPWPFGDLLSFGVQGKPSVVLYHSDIVKQKLSGALYAPLRERFLDRADVIVATSPNYAESSAILQKHKNKVKVIPLTAIPDDEPEDFKIIDDLNLTFKPFVLFVGVLRYYKGLDTLVRAARYVDCPVVIAGEGPERGYLEALKIRVKAENVVFTGEITKAQKKALYKRASVFAFPSNARSEAFGISLAEAAMYGVPMVSCEIGTGTSFINIDKITGFVVPPNDSKCFAKALNTILGSSKLSRSMQEAASSRWDAELRPALFGKRWADLFSTFK